MSTERVVGVSTRLLAGASVLCVVGLGLVIRFGWQQTGQSYSEDGTVTEADMRFADQLTMVMVDFNYRQLGGQLLLASALVAAAVVTLHRNPSWDQIRWLRWEVLGAGLLVLVPVVGLILANLYVFTAPDEALGATMDYFGPQSPELALGNLAPLGAALLTLMAAALWWLRLEADADSPQDLDDTQDLGDTQDLDDPEEVVVQEATDGHPAPTNPRRDSSQGLDSLGGEGAQDYRQEWSPEDFRPPR